MFLSVAVPFGGFDRAAKLPVTAPKEMPSSGGVSPVPAVMSSVVPTETITLRPTFNRTALGWVADGDPVVLPKVVMDTVGPLIIPESDDL